MSETLKNSIPLTEVVSPLLNDVEYASKMEGVFQNINDNFTQLANRDFVKGESGASVDIKEVNLVNEDGTLTIYGERLKASIESLSLNKDEYADVVYTIDDVEYRLNIFDYFYANPGKLQMIYNTANDNTTPVAISSLYYVFLDGRYANTVIGKIDDGQYTNIKDMSCILVYDNSIGGFRVLENAFPTIYYERGVGLCWKINGNGTGIPVQGIPGKDGANATLHIVKCNSIEETDDMIIRAEVDGIYGMYDGYIELEDDISQYDGQAALILVTNVDKGFYFGYLRVEDNNLYAYCDQETAINYGIETEAIINAMKKINLLNNGEDVSSGIKGLFIPMQEEKDGVQPVHMLSATSITNTEGQVSDLKTDFVFTPINDINTLNVNEYNNLMVDKYLYLRINPNRHLDIFADPTINQDDCAKYGYILKYKLTNVVKNINDSWFDVLNNDASGNISGSRHFGSNFNDNNVVYYNTVDKTISLTDEHYLSMPKSFASRLTGWANNVQTPENPIGIYRWELCNAKNSFDVEELATNADRYNFSNAFSVVYTTTVNPSSVSEFMWFNGINTVTPSDFGVTNNIVDDNGCVTEPGKFNGKYLIEGWAQTVDVPVLEFVKFVPIYNNAFNIDNDTALNINYNVNITGDNDNDTRSITVNGSVNCNDLNVYHLTATGEIKNIFTRETIVGESGILLGKRSDTDNNHSSNPEDYIVSIDGNGVIKTNDIYSNTLESGNINVNNGNVKQLNTNEIHVDTNAGQRRLYAGDINGDNASDEYKFGIEALNVNNINIERNENSDNLGETNKQSVITNNIPTINNNKSNIIVSNQAKESEQLCYYGVNSESNSNDGGTGVTGLLSESSKQYISSPEFDYVKNFNIHRLAVKSEATSTKNNTVLCNARSQVKLDNLSILNYETSTQRDVIGYSDKLTKDNSSKSLQTFIMRRDSQYEADNNVNLNLSTTDPIRFSFDGSTQYVCQLGIKGKSKASRWPILDANSYMELVLYYSIDDNNFTELDRKRYKLDYSTTTDGNNNGYEWYGYDKDGTYLNNRDSYYWRYYAYAFKPNTITVNVDNNAGSKFTKIVNAYNSGKTIKFYLFPEFYLHAHGQNTNAGNHKEVVAGLQVYAPIPVDSINNVTLTPGGLVKNIGKGSWNYTIKNQGANISYYAVEIPRDKNSSMVKTTTICDDGIVIRSGNVVFGLGAGNKVYDHGTYGYTTEATKAGATDSTNNSWSSGSSNTEYLSNEPILFYHVQDGGYYDSTHEPKIGGKTLEGYALRTHAIPLKDIFEVIKFIRTSPLLTYGV